MQTLCSCYLSEYTCSLHKVNALSKRNRLRVTVLHMYLNIGVKCYYGTNYSVFDLIAILRMYFTDLDVCFIQ